MAAYWVFGTVEKILRKHSTVTHKHEYMSMHFKVASC